MKHWKIILCLLTTALYNGCELYSSNSGGSPESLSGIFVDGQGNPVVGALVAAYSTNDTTSPVLAKTGSLAGSVMDSTRTDANGRFRFTHLKHGDYNLMGTVDKNGVKVVVCHQDIHFRGPVELDRDTLKDPGSVVIRAQWLSAPVQGVRCYIAGSPLSTLSNDSGECLLSNVPPGIFQIRMSKDGFLPAISDPVKVQSDKLADAGVLTLVGTGGSMKGCWGLHQSNGYYAVLNNDQTGDQFSGTSDWMNVVSLTHVPGVQTGTDSSGRIRFICHSPANSPIFGSYRADLHGDSLVNGVTISNYGDSADWYATRIACPN